MARLWTIKNSGFLLLMLSLGCMGSNPAANKEKTAENLAEIVANKRFPWVAGAERMELYLPDLEGRKVGVVANQTSQVRDANGAWVHLVDTLLRSGVDIKRVFSPEHGFRGTADAGQKVESGVDTRSGLPLVSLYGKQRKPSQDQLSDLDVILFDIQDVGVRFYTYIATLEYVMEAAAKAGKPIIVLDRPNPNGHYVGGPTLEPEFSSFLGLNPIPLVYGLTIGEYAHMVRGEGWLEGPERLDLSLVPCKGYKHSDRVSLPFRPSPNLPNDQAIALYPSLGLFEGTNVNAGRGTSHPFQQFGASFLDSTKLTHSYIPVSMPGATSPKEKGLTCWGVDLRDYPMDSLDEVRIDWVIHAYKANKGDFFKRSSFEKHSGTSYLQDWIEQGKTADEIQARWKEEGEIFEQIRRKYLMYP